MALKLKRDALYGLAAVWGAFFIYSRFATPSGTANADDPDGNSDSYGLNDLYADTVGGIVGLVNSKTVSANCIAYTRSVEGCKLTAYWDVTSYSIGYGHKPASAGQTCTQSEADAWNIADLNAAAASVAKYVRVGLSQGQLDALADFVYNLGPGKLANSTLLRLLNNGDYAGARAQFGRWIYASGQQSAALASRRAVEASWFDVPDVASTGSGGGSDDNAYLVNPGDADYGSEMDGGDE